MINPRFFNIPILNLTNFTILTILYLIKVNNMNKWDNQNTDELFKTILALKNTSEAKKFFRDLLTESELIEFGNRWKAVKMLVNNEIYIKIEKETGLSSTTIARISKWLKHGMGGYKMMIKRMNTKK